MHAPGHHRSERDRLTAVRDSETFQTGPYSAEAALVVRGGRLGYAHRSQSAWKTVASASAYDLRVRRVGWEMGDWRAMRWVDGGEGLCPHSGHGLNLVLWNSLYT